MKELPNSQEAERAVLGSILIRPDALLESELTGDMFFNSINRQCFKIMSKLENIDMLTVEQKAQDLNIKEIGIIYLSELQTEVPSASHIKQYAKIVKDKYIQRQTIIKAQTLIINIQQDDEEVLDKIQEFITDFSIISGEALDNKLQDNQKTCDEYLKEYVRKYDLIKSGKSIFFNSGFKSFEISNGQAALIAALPKQGKSMLAANIAMNISLTSKVIFFSFEMTKEEVMNRLLAIHTERDINDFRYKKLTPEETFSTLSDFNAIYKNLKIYDKAVTIEEVETICKREKLNDGLDFIILDYLQRTPTKTKMELVAKTIHNSSNFKNIVLNLEIGGLALSQFSRESTKKSFPSANDLFGGEAMKQDFDMITLLHNDSLEVENGTKTYDPLYILKKTHDRNGGNLGGAVLRRPLNKANFSDEKYEMPKWAEL